MGLFTSSRNADVDTRRKRKTGPKRISISSIHGGHSPDRRKKNAKKKPGGGPPIEVEETGWGRYRMVDGVDRVHYASEAGQTTIKAYIWK
jgi:hypothetical protein